MWFFFSIVIAVHVHFPFYIVMMRSSPSCLPQYTESKYIMAKEKMMKQQSISLPKQDGQAIFCLWLHFPSEHQSIIRGSGVRGQGIHQNSLCSMRYTKEPLRIRVGLLCLWLSTLRPIPSSPWPAGCELINHSKGLKWLTITYTALLLLSLTLQLLTHHRR